MSAAWKNSRGSSEAEVDIYLVEGTQPSVLWKMTDLMKKVQQTAPKVTRKQRKASGENAQRLQPAFEPVAALQQIVGNRATQQLLSIDRPASAFSDLYSGQVQRKIMMAGPYEWYGDQLSDPWNELTARQLRAFRLANREEFEVNGKLKVNLAKRIIQDMADASTGLKFDNEGELLTEVKKRLVTAYMMRLSQGVIRGGRWVYAFGYPNRPPASTTGPRVNEAALSYWGPMQGDSEGNYYFELSSTGRNNAYEALLNLFVLQNDPTKRTLIHCDYLTSVLHMKSFSEGLGKEEFNRKVKDGTIPFVLKWNGFTDIQESLAPSAGAVSLQRVDVASRKDLIIGDHVVFHNHPIYDALIQGVDGVWRLENAVLVDRQGNTDLFQGHGYTTPVTESHMKHSMLRQISNHVNRVKSLIKKLGSHSAKVRTQAQANLSLYKNVKLVGGEYRIVGTAFYGISVDEPVRAPDIDELPGLYDPRDPSRLYPVLRPVESK